jgi:hypothetical protein
MKILNDIACNLNWIGILKFHSNFIEFEFEWISFNIQIWVNSIQIHLKRNGMQIGSKGSENLLVTMVLERKEENSEKTQIWKDTFPFLFTWGYG